MPCLVQNAEFVYIQLRILSRTKLIHVHVAILMQDSLFTVIAKIAKIILKGLVYSLLGIPKPNL